MRGAPADLFDIAVWAPALQTYGAVTHLSVEVFDAANALAVGPSPPTPLVDVFERHGQAHGPFSDCARQCLAQAPAGRAVVVASSGGLAVVGTSLILEGDIVGAAVAGYALLDFPQTLLIERLARRAGVPMRELWDIARQTSSSVKSLGNGIDPDVSTTPSPGISSRTPPPSFNATSPPLTFQCGGGSSGAMSLKSS